MNALCVLTFLVVAQLAQGQVCSDLDVTLQKQWSNPRDSTTISFTGQTHTVSLGNEYKVFTCVEESDGFRYYRQIYTPSSSEHRCIKVLKTDPPGHLQLGVGYSGDGFCPVCTLLTVESYADAASTSCELPADLQRSHWKYTRPKFTPTTVYFGIRILTNFGTTVYGHDLVAFTCQLHKTLSSKKRILLFKSDSSFYDVRTSTNRRIYLCMKITRVSSNLFYFFLLNNLLPESYDPQERVTAPLGTVTISDDTLESFCQYDTTNPPDDVRTLQREGTSEVLPSGITLCEPFTNTCETGSEITCADIETVPYSTNISSGNSVNDTISFNCTTGYEITVGDSELTCLNNGTWNGTPPECTIIMCPDLPGISHATSSPASPTYLFNETVTFTCDDGYEHLSGDLSRTCQEDKQWSGDPPACTIIMCPDLSDISHATWLPTSPAFIFNETVTYTCNFGYEHTSGDLSRTCQEDKQWSGNPPSCTIVSCPVLSDVSHSSRVPVSPTNNFDETVTYTCDTGYEKTSGDLSRKCRSDKTWSGSSPVCTIVSCPSLAAVPNSVSNNPVPANNYGAEISYTCVSGYERKDGTLVRRCQATKQWSGSAPICGRILYEALPNVPHSTTNPNPPNTEYQSAVTYTCNIGYERASGDLTRQCQANRQWSGVSPVCKSELDLFCERLINILNKRCNTFLPLLRRKRRQNGKSENKGEYRGKKLGHCKKFVNEYLAKCK